MVDKRCRFEYLFVKVSYVRNSGKGLLRCILTFHNVVEVVVSAMEKSVGEECLGIYICMNRRVFAC